MIAKYDAEKDAYSLDEKRWHKRLDVVTLFGVTFDTTHEIREMLVTSYRLWHEEDINPNVLHVVLLQHLNERALPDWVLKAYQKHQAASVA